MRSATGILGSLALVAVLAACAAGGSARAGGSGTASTNGVLGSSTAKSTRTTRTSAISSTVCQTGTSVKLRVLKGKRGATIALVPVTIDGKGPYAFALDTGAAKSAIDSKLAKKLDLKQVATEHHVEGVSGSVKAKVVKVDSWKVGSIDLHSDTVASLDLFGGASGPAGLFGSDVLSRFSSICLDYRAGILKLGTRSGA
ncbi:MAG TPA: retropepsin-like aspartic protease [Gaiellaceae bacterium]|jgi:predicted aspartyl protease|nr:retropepsin-like aspartic protease [Gaiellaceae bacterium]